jgi:signal transduction histidine kinase
MTASLGPQSFRARLTWRWTLAVGLLLGAANAVIYAGASIYLARWLDEHVRTVAATETASSTDGPAGVHLHETPYDQLEAGRFTEKLVQIFDRPGHIVLQSTSLGTGAPLIGEDLVARALSGETLDLIDTAARGRRVRMAVLTAARDGRQYAVAVGLFADDIDRGLAALGWLLGGVWLASVAGTAALGYALASRALAPIGRITERAAWIAEGHFDARLDPPGVKDEVGRMTVLLNSMLDRLQRAVDSHRRFAADASHELRSPLTAIAGELDVALRHPRSADAYRDTLRHVRGQVSGLTGLAEDLMLLARVQEGADEIPLREVPVGQIVDESFARHGAAARHRGIVCARAGLDGITAYTDRALLTRVIDNVVANAVHYNRDGGRVTVGAHVARPAPGAWAPTLVTLDVTDTGSGIPVADHERVFERFFRLDESRRRHTGGTGLGLAICREVMRALGGTIRVRASSPEGTTIAITLPGDAADANAGGTDARHSGRVETASKDGTAPAALNRTPQAPASGPRT